MGQSRQGQDLAQEGGEHDHTYQHNVAARNGLVAAITVGSEAPLRPTHQAQGFTQPICPMNGWQIVPSSQDMLAYMMRCSGSFVGEKIP